MSVSEQDLTQLEEQFPAISGQVFANAREQALAAGQSILISQDGIIYRVYPDGRRRMVKRIAAATPVVVGTRFTLR
jgi:hypothetical protein